MLIFHYYSQYSEFDRGHLNKLSLNRNVASSDIVLVLEAFFGYVYSTLK